MQMKLSRGSLITKFVVLALGNDCTPTLEALAKLTLV